MFFRRGSPGRAAGRGSRFVAALRGAAGLARRRLSVTALEYQVTARA